MSIKTAIKRLTTPVAELDDRNLLEFCHNQAGVVEISSLKPRQEGTIVGEISSVRIVPKRDGSPWLEVSINDGSGALTAIWTGRGRLAGVKPGARLILTGRAIDQRDSNHLLILNPRYELL